MMSVLSNIVIFAYLVLLPIFTWWWIFIILSIGVLTITERRVAPMLAGLVLDSLYFGSNSSMPYLTAFSLILAMLSVHLRDKMRISSI
jgi:hypothetical protein